MATKIDLVNDWAHRTIELLRAEDAADCRGSADLLEWMWQSVPGILESGDSQSSIISGLVSSARDFVSGNTVKIDQNSSQEFLRCMSRSRAILLEYFPTYLKRQKKMIQKALDRGSIKSQEEYFAVRDYLDQLEDESPDDPIIDDLNRLIGA